MLTRDGCATPTDSASLDRSRRNAPTYLATRSALTSGTSARVSHGFWVATPVGQVPSWHFIVCRQPTASIASRATLTRSAPIANAIRAFSGSPSLPEPMNTTRSVMPRRAKAEYARGNAAWNGSETWSA